MRKFSSTLEFRLEDRLDMGELHDEVDDWFNRHPDRNLYLLFASI